MASAGGRGQAGIASHFLLHRASLVVSCVLEKLLQQDADKNKGNG